VFLIKLNRHPFSALSLVLVYNLFNMKRSLAGFVLVVMAVVYSSFNQPAALLTSAADSIDAGKVIKTGADQTEKYLSYLKGKRIGILGNKTSIIGRTHLVDSLRSLGVNIVKAFGPEHGFRGNASAGVKVQNEVDSATGIPIISLYGSKRKPSKEDLANVDLMIYDIQDVGCRFYSNGSLCGKWKRVAHIGSSQPQWLFCGWACIRYEVEVGHWQVSHSHYTWYDHRRVCANDQWRRLVA
jgi:hypothetical protein